MHKFLEDIKFGVGLGIGLCLAWAVLQLIIWFLSHAQMPGPMAGKQ